MATQAVLHNRAARSGVCVIGARGGDRLIEEVLPIVAARLDG